MMRGTKDSALSQHKFERGGCIRCGLGFEAAVAGQCALDVPLTIYGGKSKHPLIGQAAQAVVGSAASGGGVWLLVGIFIADLPIWTAFVGVPLILVGLVLVVKALGLIQEPSVAIESATGPVSLRFAQWEYSDCHATVREIEFVISAAVYRSLENGDIITVNYRPYLWRFRSVDSIVRHPSE